MSSMPSDPPRPEPRAPVFALVDCNNFFCSCERVFNPALLKRPVAVLSNNDGCVIARSNEVKALGIPMGAPYHQVSDRLRRAGAAVFSSNFQLYGDISGRVMASLRRFTPDIEVYSIDEAFLRLDGFQEGRDLAAYAAEIRQSVGQWTGVPVSVGLAPTKTLAKIASHMAKKHAKNGTFDLRDEKRRAEVLARFPVEDVWGIGRKSAKKLQARGIYTAGDLVRRMDGKRMREAFSVTGERILAELKGISCLELEETQPKKQIISSASFGQRLTKLEDISSAVAHFTARAGEKLRRQGHKAQGLYVYLQTNRFGPDYYTNGATRGFDTPTSDTAKLLSAARAGLESVFEPGRAYQKAGIMLLDLVPDAEAQYDLFNPGDAPKRITLMEAMDALNNQMGGQTIRFAAQDVQRDKDGWVARAEHRSQRYTTSWDELPVVRVG